MAFVAYCVKIQCVCRRMTVLNSSTVANDLQLCINGLPFRHTTIRKRLDFSKGEGDPHIENNIDRVKIASHPRTWTTPKNVSNLADAEETGVELRSPQSSTEIWNGWWNEHHVLVQTPAHLIIVITVVSISRVYQKK